MLLAVTALTSCVDDDKLEYSYEKPASIAGYEYLNDYAPLKTYKNAKAAPDFKLGVALAAADYNADGLVTRLANSNFDEVVAGNAMKMASCVNDKGEMDFGTVSNFVTNATENGMQVYGHTLAWHAQQPVKWLNKLIADKVIEVDPDEMVEKEDYYIDYTTYSKFPFYVMGYEPEFSAEEGLISLSSEGWYQYFAADQMGLAEGNKYKVTITYKSPVDASITSVLRWDWGSGMMEGKIDIKAGDDWQQAEIQYNSEFGGSGGFVVFQLSGVADQRICIKDLKVSHSAAAGPATYFASLISNGDMEGDDAHNFASKENAGSTVYQIYDGVGVGGSRGVKIDAKGGQPDAWESQFWIVSDEVLHIGDVVHVAFDYRAEGGCVGTGVDTQAHFGPGEYQHYQCAGTVNFTDAWQTYDKTFTVDASMATAEDKGMKSIAFNMSPNATDGTYFIDNVVLEIEKAGDGIPLTPEEKIDTLTWAMEQWISGMMEACEGKVKAWDVVNEAISGADADGDGYYDLQHGSEENTTDFFWQDHMGDALYVQTAVRLARQYGPEGVTLFVNDYNLESDWDGNKKLESLIHWIGVWESDGVTKIDGIGSQMHISCYADPTVQESKKNGIENMLTMMVQSGKLVRISELDMGYIDADGNEVATAKLTEAQHKEMAALYTWIIKKYFEIVPAAQQWGICQWCITDSPADSGWRPNTPTGLWDQNYNRKHTYAGFADGLQGK
jgi:GH35 family endo-1,4-beta-xylanase